MAKIIMYTSGSCPYCHFAKQLLDQKKASYTEIRIDLQPELKDEMIARSGRKTVPQIFINDQAIGGYDDMYALEKAGKLEALLATEK